MNGKIDFRIYIQISYTFSVCILCVDRISFSLVYSASLQGLTVSFFLFLGIYGLAVQVTLQILLLPLTYCARASQTTPRKMEGCADQVTQRTECWEMGDPISDANGKWTG